MLEKFGNDTIEVFGESGTGKTTFVKAVLEHYSDRKSIYIDTERNLLDKLKNGEYKYIPDFKELFNFIMHLPDGYQLVVLDSIGLPILGEFATMGLNERGDVLLKAQAICYSLKVYSHKNNALILITNQPESEFAKEKGHVCRPFGDKSIYFFKEVWKTFTRMTIPSRTICDVKAFRSRFYGRDKPIFQITIADAGVEVKPV
jgi:GTPase SAR1 family protein